MFIAFHGAGPRGAIMLSFSFAQTIRADSSGSSRMATEEKKEQVI